ncbi:MAG: carbohydrate ABC transporter permease [Limnochordia bacterium]|nr:MAG: ABC transporter permease [Peptococcaceae bacterium 1109]
MGKKRLTDTALSWLFLTPTFIVLIIAAFLPLLYSLWLSFHALRLNMPAARPVFIGLENYTYMLQDTLLKRSTQNNIIFVTFTVSLQMFFGLVIAMLVSGDDRLSRFLRTIFLVPMIMAPVASGTLWRMMLDRTTGVVNYLLSLIGITAIPWLGQPLTAMIAVILVDVWRLTPWVVIILVSAIKGISISLFEAALVDGASPWEIFKKIVLPLLKPVLLIVAMIRIIDGFKVFDIIYVMTGGGPGIATEMLPNFIYNQGLRYFNAGYSAALAWVFIICMSLLSLIFVRLRLRQEG